MCSAPRRFINSSPSFSTISTKIEGAEVLPCFPCIAFLTSSPAMLYPGSQRAMKRSIEDGGIDSRDQGVYSLTIDSVATVTDERE